MPPLDPRPDFRELAPWPPGIRFLDGPAERILQGQLPPRPDHPARTLTGSSAGQATDADLAERSQGDLIAARARARDAEQQRRKRAAARVEPRVSKIRGPRSLRVFRRDRHPTKKPGRSRALSYRRCGEARSRASRLCRRGRRLCRRRLSCGRVKCHGVAAFHLSAIKLIAPRDRLVSSVPLVGSSLEGCPV
jgi:hypothetical protein